MDEIMKERVLGALQQMKEAYSVLNEYAGEEPIEKAFNESRATDIYPHVFAKSFDELEMERWCDAMTKAITPRKAIM